MALSTHSAASRIAALCLLIALIAAFGVALGVPLVHEYRLAIAEVEQHRLALDGYRRVAGREANLRQGIETLKGDRSLKDVVLPAGSESGATATMQDRVQSIIGGAGAWLTSVQPLPATAEDGHRRMGLRLAFATDIKALRQILYKLEYGRPVMILDSVYIHARTARAVGVGNPLEVRLDIFAFKPDSAS